MFAFMLLFMSEIVLAKNAHLLLAFAINFQDICRSEASNQSICPDKPFINLSCCCVWTVVHCSSVTTGFRVGVSTSNCKATTKAYAAWGKAFLSDCFFTTPQGVSCSENVWLLKSHTYIQFNHC